MTWCDLAAFTSAQTVIITGEQGEGKTEAAINLVLCAVHAGRTATIVDLDVVTPLFRSRDAEQIVKAAGARVLTPPAALRGSDLPLVPADITGALQAPGAFVVFDCGGGTTGARAMASVSRFVKADQCDVVAVINPYRPFFSSTAMLNSLTALGAESQFRIQAIVSNPHLGRETTAHTVIDGHRRVCAAANAAGYEVRCLAVAADLAAEVECKVLVPVLPLQLHMVPPWSGSESGGES